MPLPYPAMTSTSGQYDLSQLCIVLLFHTSTYSLCDIVYYNCAVGIAVVHGCQRLVAFLSGSIPDFKLDSGVLVEGNGLGEEGGADGGLSVRIELILQSFGQYNDTGNSRTDF